MKVNKYVMGQYKGQIEVSPDSITGMLLKSDLEGAGQKTIEMQRELNKLCGKPSEKPSESGDQSSVSTCV